MIQNILSKDENSTKQRTEKREPIFSCVEADDKNINTSYIPALTPNIIVAPAFQQAQLIPQPSLSCLPNTSHSYGQNSESCNIGQGMSCLPSFYADIPSATINSVNMDMGKKTNGNDTVTNSSSYTVPKRVPLQLPDWLNDCCHLPEVYKKACGLVESSHGWVDTSRAYMLLMKTNIPPHLLGVLWEMVNRNEPGRLQIAEFCGLLALVALIQNGKSFVDAEILKSTVAPVYPLINHPALLALSQAELSKQQCLETNSIASGSQPVSASFPDDDEFDDFVCAIPPPVIVNENEPVSSFITTSKPQEISPPIVHPTPLVHKSKASDQERSLNFPSLGNSPLNHNKCENKEVDEFSDFQSAFNPSDELVLSLSAANDSKDKYDVFRELTKGDLNSVDIKKNINGQQENINMEENDHSFGEFYSSEPVIRTDISSIKKDEKNSSSIVEEDTSENLVNTKFVCHFNNEPFKNDSLGIKIGNDTITSANNWTKDPFGEFEVSSKMNSIPNDFSSDSSQYVTANASAETSSDPEDDFGDFIGPSEVMKEIVSNPGTFSFNLPELQSETQSVASLELPGLEMTVNLTADPVKIELRNDDQIDFEQQFKSFSFEVPIAKCSDKENGQLPPVPVVTPESLPIADKYSIIRDVQQMERCFGEPHIESWKKCLNGCNKLFHDGLMILESIKDKKLLAQVLITSQMQDYLFNLAKVHEVQLRILNASQNMTTTIEIQELLIRSQDVWKSILNVVGEKLKLEVNSVQESKATTDETICSLCLQNGGASLLHGGLSYHPPCANLWLNVVDLTLPSLNHTKGSLLLS